jgi:hypothetical protein
MDPPVATYGEAPAPVFFAKSIPPPEWSTSSVPDDSTFCQTCLKNQHLYNASLAQYLPEDTNDPQYAQLARNIKKFKEDLERRYPQVCENCVDRVRDRMKKAAYGAKVAWQGKLLENTRASRDRGKRKPKTWMEMVEVGVKGLWKAGLYSQLVWEVARLLEGLRPSIQDFRETFPDTQVSLLETATTYFYIFVDTVYSSSTSLPITIISRLPTLPVASLLLSLLSLWWNPQFQFTIKESRAEVIGARNWYINQTVLLLVRALIWYGDGKWIFSTPGSSINVALHLFLFAFTLWILKSSARDVKVRFRPLFESTPDREKFISKPQATNSTPSKVNDLAQELDNIMQETRSGSPSSSSTSLYDSKKNTSSESLLSMSALSTVTTLTSATTIPTNNEPKLWREASPSPRTSSRGLITSLNNRRKPQENSLVKIPAKLQFMSSNDAMTQSNEDEMDWTPSQSTYRAFQPSPPSTRDSQTFGQAPANKDSVFWAKVPAAPTTPAQRLRNPLNKPRLANHSQEKKENFFANMTGSKFSVSGSDGNEEANPTSKHTRKNYEFAQPKFFPPSDMEDATGLVDIFSKTIKFDDEDGQKPANPHWRRPDGSINSMDVAKKDPRHAITAVVSIALLLLWNFAFVSPNENSNMVIYGVLIACILIGLREMADHGGVFMAEKASGEGIYKIILWSAVGAIVSGVQVIMAVTTLLDIITGADGGGSDGILGKEVLIGCEGRQERGKWLLSGMMVHQAALALAWWFDSGA